MSSRSTPTAGKRGQSATRAKAGKTADEKAPSRRASQVPPRPSAKKSGLVSPEERKRFIAEAAYFKAEQRGFADGGELADWMEAEAEIDALLNSRGAG